MAVYGVTRSTRDLDLLTLDAACLAPSVWAPLERDGIVVQVRRGDADDPLAGAARLTAPDQSAVDVIVGRSGWQAGILERATPRSIEGELVPVAAPADLIVLKLYAAGPQDAWDVEQLLASGDRRALAAAVEAALPLLPEDSRRLWARIVGPR
jgi:hypothetical protein